MTNIFPTYQQYPIDIIAGHDWYLTDNLGNDYLDFTSGIGVCNFGYSNETIIQNVEAQMHKIWHTSNLYESALVEEVAESLGKESDMLAFFCNSGTEANEAALKLARKATGKSTVLAFKHGFHGRTYGAMSVTGNPSVSEGFEPLLPKTVFAEYNNDAAIEMINQQLAAVILEVIQGEGGVINGQVAWLQQVQAACRENGVLLIIDEVQTGMGRTGSKFAYEHFDLDPDIVTVAKGIANGLPLGVMLGKRHLASAFGRNSHGTTFGGNKMSLAAAKGVLEQLTPDFLTIVNDKAEVVWQFLSDEIASLPAVESVSGKGLMIGIHLPATLKVQDIIKQLQEDNLLTLSAHQNTLRLLPPLVMPQAELLQGLNKIKKVLQTVAVTEA